MAVRKNVEIRSDPKYTEYAWDTVYGAIERWSQKDPANKEFLVLTEEWISNNLRTTSADQEGWTNLENIEDLFQAADEFFTSRKSEHPMQFQFVVDTSTELVAHTLIHLGKIGKDLKALLALGTTGVVAELAGTATTTVTGGASAVLGAAVGAACLGAATVKGVSLATEMAYTLQDIADYYYKGQVIVTMGIESKSPLGKIAYAVFEGG